MKVWTMWHGGPNYAAPDQFQRRDVEPFPSIAEARAEFEYRATSPYGFPGVEGSTMYIFFTYPHRDGDAFPDRVLTQGPPGGTRMERA